VMHSSCNNVGLKGAHFRLKMDKRSIIKKSAISVLEWDSLWNDMKKLVSRQNTL
jgi:hypothetical protein